MNNAAELQITCLGDFRVTLDETALTVFPTGKSRALGDLTGSKGLMLVFFRSADW